MTYSISEAAEILDVAPSTLRYYDKEGLLPFVSRTPSGARQFTDKDFPYLRLIQCLKKTGLPIRMIREFIDLPADGKETAEKRLDILIRQQELLREKMEEIRDMMNVVEYKLWFYRIARDEGMEVAERAAQSGRLPEKLRAGREQICRPVKK